MSIIKCPCQQNSSYENCCKRFHTSPHLIKTPIQLVYARYSAFVLKLPNYIKYTMKDPSLKHFDVTHIVNSSISWQGISIISSKYPEASSSTCLIQFKVTCKDTSNANDTFCVNETGLFKFIDNQWFYIDALRISQENITN
jgi:SEC-C motif domain protein